MTKERLLELGYKQQWVKEYLKERQGQELIDKSKWRELQEVRVAGSAKRDIEALEEFYRLYASTSMRWLINKLENRMGIMVLRPKQDEPWAALYDEDVPLISLDGSRPLAQQAETLSQAMVCIWMGDSHTGGEPKEEYKEMASFILKKIDLSEELPPMSETWQNNGSILCFYVVWSVLDGPLGYTHGANLLGEKDYNVIKRLGVELGVIDENYLA